VLEHDGHLITDTRRIDNIGTTLKRIIAQDELSALPTARRLTRRQKHFNNTTTRLNFFSEPNSAITVMELITSDRPGLLSLIGKVFVDCNVKVHNAKIGTFGEYVEDIFYISDKDDQAISDVNQIEALRESFFKALDNN